MSQICQASTERIGSKGCYKGEEIADIKEEKESTILVGFDTRIFDHRRLEKCRLAR